MRNYMQSFFVIPYAKSCIIAACKSSSVLSSKGTFPKARSRDLGFTFNGG